METDAINRRKVLGQLTGAGVGAILLTGWASRKFTPKVRAGHAPADHSVTILLDEPIATIRPELYSQFTEHIGGVIYDGIWVGPKWKVANIDGIRRQLI